ncbi:DUF4288 domain-containing protein [Rhodoferax sp.]|uniref:DUF4288 domain-containing protein n=1 Tax=Rhodoferax sp. TaxID=50421 RepID=UPI003A102895
MSIWRAEWPWYVATFVIAERTDGLPKSYALSTYLIRAIGAEEAYLQAEALARTLGDSFRDGKGTVVRHECLGLADLDTLQEDEMKHGTHLLWTKWPSTEIPAMRTRNELSLFLPPVPPNAI